MGIFSKIKKALNPLDTSHPIGNPGGFILGNVLKGTQSGKGSAPSAEAAAVDPAGDAYYGDPNDSAYGSFTRPFDVEEFYNYADPGYAFELQQGTQALQNSAAAGSGALSGAALKDLLGYSQNFARTGYNDAFNRYQVQQGNIFSRLSSIAQLGQNAAAGVGSTGANIVGNAGQQVTNAGGAAGAGIVGAGNALGGGLSDYWLWKNYGGMGGGAPGTGAGLQAGYNTRGYGVA